MGNLGFLLMKVSKDLKYKLNKELQNYDLTSSQWAVLKRMDIIEDSNLPPNKRTAVSIASELDFDKPTISGIINRLIEKEMIIKKANPNDGRSNILVLTKKSKELIPTIEKISDEVIENSLNYFSNEEKVILLDLLNKMDRSLNEEEEQ